MKRIILVLPALLLVLTACADVALSDSQMASAVQTLTATVLPPTPTATSAPDANAIVLLLNRGLAETSDPLSQTIDARYQVLDASFPLDAGQKASAFLVNVRCDCINGSSCCTPERTFVVLVAAMKPVADKIGRQIPATVNTLQVASLDHSTVIGMVMVKWQDMVDYFSGAINGFQLGGRSVTLAGQ